MFGFVVSQFRHPTGLVGRLVGAIMALKNRERNAWAVALLDVQPGDHVLEIGCGPGWAIQRLSEQSAAARIVGVDHSAVMVEQTRARNAAAVRQGRVDVRLGSVSHLAFPENTFDRAFAVNAFHFWPDPVADLKAVRRVLKPGGVLAITEQPISAATEADIRALGGDLAGQLTAAGFKAVRLEARPMRPNPSVCALGTK